MKKYVLNEVKGKVQGRMIIVEADNAKEACEKSGMTEIIKPYEKFSEMYFGEIFEVYEWGKPYDVEYVCHK